MDKEYICKHCKGDLRVRNPMGNCDHLYYPYYCLMCSSMKYTMQGEKMDTRIVEGFVKVGKIFGVRVHPTLKFSQKKGTELLYHAMKDLKHKHVKITVEVLE